MKKLSKILTIILSLAIAISLVACSNSYRKLERAFEKEGFSVVENSTTANMEESGKEYGVKAHYLEKKETITTLGVLILEFKATDDMIEFYNDNEIVRNLISGISEDEDAKAFYDALVEQGFAKGNCMVFPASLSSLFALETICGIVKNA